MGLVSNTPVSTFRRPNQYFQLGKANVASAELQVTCFVLWVFVLGKEAIQYRCGEDAE